MGSPDAAGIDVAPPSIDACAVNASLLPAAPEQEDDTCLHPGSLAEVWCEIEGVTAHDVDAGLGQVARHLRGRLLSLLAGAFENAVLSNSEEIGFALLDTRSGRASRTEDVARFRTQAATGQSEPEALVRFVFYFLCTDDGLEIYADDAHGESSWGRFAKAVDPQAELRAVLQRVDGNQIADSVKKILLTERTLLLAAAAVGTVGAIFRYVLAYTKRRVTFGKAICHHQAVALKLADAATSLRTCHLLCLEAARCEVESGSWHLPFLTEYVSERLAEAGVSLVQLMGGHGFLDLHPTSGLLRSLNYLQFLLAEAREYSEAL